jgi:hypothetical protein
MIQELIHLAEPVVQEASFGVVAIVSGAVAVAGSAVGAISAGKAEKRARSNKNRLMGELEALENKRQEIINPYSDVTSLSDMISDVSGLASDVSSIASNPYANLAVSTASAEMQIEQADIALANTLDTLRATGASAGGATALARMALESKKGVAASIERQEADNQKLMAQGEERRQDVQIAEAQRIQGLKIGEAQRVQGQELAEARRIQQAEVQGDIYEFETREGRQQQQLDRKQAQITGAAQQQAVATQAKSQAISSGVNAVGNITGSLIG